MIETPRTEPLSREDLKRWAGEGKTGLVLHSVGNDHNLGAMIRSAAFFGAAYIVICEGDPEARLTTSSYRVAEGGMEHVTIRRVRNTAAFLKEASGSIVTIGTDLRARRRIRDMESVIDAAGLKAASGGRPGIALVLGNEETGLPQAVKDACSALLRVPGTGLMESLNVAQTTALFLHELYEL
jgi:TrmH RNA methyltransferase